ncbi:Uncharacterised protein [Legionella busanensis]|uniref:Uncharacterized protein n=1 Tax=Legionella busanensis TaxID=190655 RepID=A0A378JJ44_9GAMM|nr:hypothetical protein [Legionella busanensis]STX50718.1 Uncharacterised protein [Legionella busanensis]
MSRLQDFMSKLGHVIIHYAEAQPPKTSYPADEILAKPHDEMIKELINIIDTKVKYDTRRPCLDYFLYVIKELKKVCEQDAPLNEQEIASIKSVLNNFLITLFELLDISKTDEIELKYNNITKNTPRFISNWTFSKTSKLSGMGTIVTDYLINNISAKSNEEVSAYIEKLVSEHQGILMVPVLTKQQSQFQEEIHSLNLALKNTVESNEKLQLSLTQEEEKSKELQKTINFFETTQLDDKKTNLAKDETISSLTNQIKMLKEELEAAKQQIHNLEDIQHKSQRKIGKLEEENRELKAKHLDEQNFAQKEIDDLDIKQPEEEKITSKLEEKKQQPNLPFYNRLILPTAPSFFQTNTSGIFGRNYLGNPTTGALPRSSTFSPGNSNTDTQ